MKFFNNIVAFFFALAIMALYFVPRLTGASTTGYDHLVILFISLFLLATAFQNTSIHDKLSDVKASLSRAWLNIRRLQNENEGQNAKIDNLMSKIRDLYSRLNLHAEVFSTLEKSVKRMIDEQNNIVNVNNEAVTNVMNANRDLRDSIEDNKIRIIHEAHSCNSGDDLLMSRIRGIEEAIDQLKEFTGAKHPKPDPKPAYRLNYMETESWLKEISERLNEEDFCDSCIDAIVNDGAHGVGNETTFTLAPEDLQDLDDDDLDGLTIQLPNDPVLIKNIIQKIMNTIIEYMGEQWEEVGLKKGKETKKRQNTESKAAKKSKTKKS